MSSILGNSLALLVLLISMAVASLSSIATGAAVYGTLSYLVLGWSWTGDRLARPPVQHSVLGPLTPGEAAAGRNYHIHLIAPAGADALSNLLNGLRFLGLGWTALALWNGLLWTAMGLTAFYFLSAGLIARLAPHYYLRVAAMKGNTFAAEQLRLIDTLRAKRTQDYIRKPSGAAEATQTKPLQLQTTEQAIIARQVRERALEAQKGFDYQFRVRQETHRLFLVHWGVLTASPARTRSDDWYTCLSVYAATLLAVTKAHLQVSRTVLDRYRTEVIERMVSSARMATRGTPDESRADATADIDGVTQAVDASFAGKGSYLLEPVADWLAVRVSVGRDSGAVKPISALIAIDATACRDELVPAIVKDLDG